MSEQSEPRVKRPRLDKSGRFAALEKLKQLKGAKHKYEIAEELDNVYEVVDEREYAKKAQKKYGGDWIEEEGPGYAEDGRDFFEDEDEYSDDETDVKKSSAKKNPNKRAREEVKPSKGKNLIRNILSGDSVKKNSEASAKKNSGADMTVKDDYILADILGELNEDNATKPTSSKPRVKRPRLDKSGRFAALEKLKQLKATKHKYEVAVELDNVYEVVDEREYAKKTQEKYGGDWIEEEGPGYAEDGRDFFEDEDEYSDDETDVKKSSSKKNPNKRAREEVKPSKGKNLIRNILSGDSVKKNSEASAKKNSGADMTVKDDYILADILRELNVDNATKPTSSNLNQSAPKVIAPAKIISASSTSLTARKSETTVGKDLMNSFKNIAPSVQKKPTVTEELKICGAEDRILQPKLAEANKTIEAKEKVIKQSETLEVVEEKVKTQETELKQHIEDDSFPDVDMDFECLEQAEQNVVEQVPKVDKLGDIEKETQVKQSTPAHTEADDMQKLLNNWESICQMDNFEEEINATSANNDAAGDESENLRFWYWEAWEDAYKRPGEVFLFGRTADGESICVHLDHIERVLYLLPREYLLDPITKEPTGTKVTYAEIYKEFKGDICPQLKLEDFRARKVKKNFGYHSLNNGINVPPVCDYVEIRYDGKKPAPSMKKRYNSIAHIFGANTTSLENFLLEHKIKGPCWLNMKSFKKHPTPISWCKTDVTVSDPKHITVVLDAKPAPPPPLILLTINVRTVLNTKTLKNEICMISMLVHNRFPIDKPAPQPIFNRQMCGFTRPAIRKWPSDLNAKLSEYKATRFHKHETERALLSWFVAQYQQIDADLIVTFDAVDCQLDVITERVVETKIPLWSRLGRVRLTQLYGKKMLDFFIGRMVCDVKRSAEDACIKARSYDLKTLCQNVLKLKENERIDLNDEDIVELYSTGDGVLKLMTLTMQDASYVLRLMCELNIMPLALQLTNICGNTMTRTLQGGRSERNEFLLLHAFTEKNYIVPDKRRLEFHEANTAIVEADGTNLATGSATARKKAAFSGGMVLEPIKGLYDKYVLLMDFNSLYPSIIQEYNICFTTVPQPCNNDELPDLPDSSKDQGILPQQLRRLVESRREVKKLMAAPDLSPELRMQYQIRQMALKLTANSMYGCLGFAHSRFFAQHLAALVTHKGRDILMNTKNMVQKMNYEVVYGDTDSLMVNTNIMDYDQVFKIGHSIKQTVNKAYKQLELDIDGVFSVLLLLKKKKYAAVKVSKNAKGELIKEQEYKGLDIVRRDWSQLAVKVGHFVLDEILSDKQLDEKLEAVHAHLEHVATQVRENSVPLSMYVITKQLSRAPDDVDYIKMVQPHAQVALRMNKERKRRYKKGDMIDYVICDDGTNNPVTKRAYHLDEVRGSETLKIDFNFYLTFQIHPVVTRLVEVLEGTDASRIAECLGLDPTKYKTSAQRSHQERVEDASGESLIKSAVEKYQDCEKFKFICIGCKTENLFAAAFKPSSNNEHTAVLEKCTNPECNFAPFQYVVSIRNQLVLFIRKCITRFYQNWLVCDNPSCNRETRVYSLAMRDCRPICKHCKNGMLLRQYSERNLYNQLCYFQYIFDATQYKHKNVVLAPDVEAAYCVLRETVDQQLQKSDYARISLGALFSQFKTLEESFGASRLKIDLHTDFVPLELDDI